MSQKPFMWNNNNPVEYQDPSGYETGDISATCALNKCQAFPLPKNSDVYVKVSGTAGPLNGSIGITGHGHVFGGIAGAASVGRLGGPGGAVHSFSNLATGAFYRSGSLVRSGALGLGKSTVGVSGTAGVILPGPGQTANQTVDDKNAKSIQICGFGACLGGALTSGGGLMLEAGGGTPGGSYSPGTGQQSQKTP